MKSRRVILLSIVSTTLLLIIYKRIHPSDDVSKYQNLRKETWGQEEPKGQGDTSTASAKPNWKTILPYRIEPKNYLPNFFTQYRNESFSKLYENSDFVFVHVPKSGGTTVASCLKSVAKKMKKYKHTNLFIGENLHSLFPKLKQRPELGIYSGEYAFGLCDANNKKPCGYFLLMRDPYERIISGYTYCTFYADEKKPRCALAPKQLDIIEWALLQKSYLFRMLVTDTRICSGEIYQDMNFNELITVDRTMLTGDYYPCWMRVQAVLDHKMSKQNQKELLTYLVDHLEEWFAVVGVLEDLHGVYEALADSFKLPVIPSCTNLHNNKGKYNKNKVDQIKETYRTKLKNDPRVTEALHADIVLYEKVKEISKRQENTWRGKM